MLNKNILSKADTLLELKNKLKESAIEDVYVFTVDGWLDKPSQILKFVKRKFSPKKVIVRSSSVYEDNVTDSKAGYFYTQLGVDSNDSNSISTAISNVVDSYRERSVGFNNNQVMVQPQLESVLVSGVVFTRQLGTNAPYYIINYDDTSGKTDTITGGKAGSLECIFRYTNISKKNRWFKLLNAVKEVEGYFHGEPLDIEFAITKKKKIVIFQVRHLAANYNVQMPDDEHIKSLKESMKAKFRRFSMRVPHLAGERTIFGDMPDWNPAEIIGSRPNTLDYTLYSFLFTDHSWHEARTSLGYKDVFPGELMTSFGKRPYIDMRLSFNSFTPSNIPDEFREKLVNYYLYKLHLQPEKQDKVEFEILWTCYDFSLKDEVVILKEHGFSKKDINILISSLRNLTNNIIEKSSNIVDKDIELIACLTKRTQKIMKANRKHGLSPWDLFTDAYNLLQNCKKFGAVPFARSARIAFIAKAILMSMRYQNIISNDSYYNILSSIETVASSFNRDLALMQSGKMGKKDFFTKYGHLRPGTYDITASRYDTIKHLFKEHKSQQNNCKYTEEKNIVSSKELNIINKEMKRHGLYGNGNTLLRFIKRSIEYREYSKFEFTKTLSDALEVIARAGAILGFSRNDLSHVDLMTLVKFRNPEYSDIKYAKKMIRQSKERHYKEKEWSGSFLLPPVIRSELDFDYVVLYEARPNFITTKTTQGPILHLNKKLLLHNRKLNRYIVMLENADPGFDWIFTKEPLGLITKYGGVASHMAIRCAEFNIPAAIGCGESIYDDLLKSKVIFIDCAKKILKPLTL